MTEFFMKTKYDLKDLEAAAEMIAEGMPIAKVLEATGMSYSPVWCYSTWSRNRDEGKLVDLSGLSQSEADAAIKVIREEGNSWGDIACLVSRTENACRKSYERASNIRSEGTRIGHGGRYLADREELYTGEGAHGDRSVVGPRLTVGTTVNEALAQLAAEDAKDLTSMKKADLATLVGYTDKLSKITKDELLTMAAEAINA